MGGRYGDSPLHIAVKNGRVSVAKMLIAKGADVNLKNEVSTKTPRDEAVHPKISTLKTKPSNLNLKS